jgi:DNA modification methylase
MQMEGLPPSQLTADVPFWAKPISVDGLVSQATAGNDASTGLKRVTEQLSIAYRPIAELKAHPGNPRTHSKKQIRQIARSVEQFGFTNPILLDQQDRVLAGHGRLAAARLLVMAQVPTIRLAEMSEAQKRAYALADNRLAEAAGWDRELLALELRYISELEVDFDLELTGFEMAEIDLLLDPAAGAPDTLDRLPEADGPPVTTPGDLWCLGRHRVLCADATSAAAFERVMAGKAAQLVLTDPPYNVPTDGHVCGLGRTRHPDFAMASGEMSEAEFTAFLTTVLGHAAGHSADGALHFVFMDWRHLIELLTAGRAIYRELKNLCVWVKDNGGMGSLYRSQHELVLVFKNGNATHVNNVELGRHGRNRSNVWRHPGVNSVGAGRAEELRLHPTVKPVQLVADAILDASKRRGVVLDPFLGSGTTLLAAERTGRQACGLEVEPRYVDVAIRRWQEHTGRAAVHVESGLTFDGLAEHRAAAPTAAVNAARQPGAASRAR